MDGLYPMEIFRKRYLPVVQAARLDWGACWWIDAVTAEEAKAEVRAFLKDRIDQMYRYYREKNYCPIYARENVQRACIGHTPRPARDSAANGKAPGDADRATGDNEIRG